MTDPNASPSTAVTSLKAMYNGCMDTETIEVNLKSLDTMGRTEEKVSFLVARKLILKYV